MVEGHEICSVSPSSDIGYYLGCFFFINSFVSIEIYLVKSPTPFKNRDFVTQRCWLDLGRNQEKYIINHSVNHLVHDFHIAY
jgi:hypothetical protein